MSHRLPGRSPGMRSAAAILMLLLLAPAACRAKQESAFRPPNLDLPFINYRLSNGLEVILREDHRVPIAAVNLWYHVGPANERKGRAGFAHLFEHMMLQGSGHAPGDYFTRLQAAGATGVNANTDLDRTSYVEAVPANQLELALWLESDRMGFLLDALDELTLANQKAVARNERRQNIENAPYGLAGEEVYRLLFPAGHPYRSSVLGSHADIQSATLDEVREFFKRFYVPNNASLAVVGDIDITRTSALIRKYFGSLPRGGRVPPVRVPPAGLDAEKRRTMTDRVELPAVRMAWHTGRAFTGEDAVATVTARLFGGGKASRLFENLVYRQKIAQDASARQRSLAHGSVFSIAATAKPGHTAAEVEKSVLAELERLADQGPGEKELLATKTALAAIAIKSLEPFGQVADRLNAYNHFVGDPDFLNKDLSRYARVTVGDVKKFVSRKLLVPGRVVVHVRPGEKKLPPEPAEPPPPPKSRQARPNSVKEPWRNQAPPPGPAAPAIPPAAKEFQLANGLSVFVAQSHSLPLVVVRLVALAGSASDPPQLPGVTGFMAGMLNEGAGRRNATEIADDLTALGSTLETGSSKETSFVSLVSLKSKLRHSMMIAQDVAASPTFPAAEIERVRNDRLTALRQQRDNPATVARKVMWRELYGESHPYAHVDPGAEQSVTTTRRRDLQDSYRRVFGPKNSALIFVGDVTAAEARKLAEEYFGSFKGSATRPAPPPPPVPSPERTFVIDRPGAPQATVLLAQTALPRSDPDYPQMTLLNQTLGGLFSSRLNLNLRETHGYTYGVSSKLFQNRGAGPLEISTSVNAEFTGPAVGEALKEVAGLKQRGVTDHEVREAKDSILFSVADLYDTNASAAGTISSLFSLELPMDNLQGLPGRLNAMTTATIAGVAARYLRPEDMKVILVGDRAKIEPQLTGLGLGPVVYRTVDGLPP